MFSVGVWTSSFLPRYIECILGLAMRILSVRLSNAWIVTKRKKNESRFFIPHERTFSLVFWEKNGCWGRPLLPEILGQPEPVGVKSPILNRYSLTAPHSAVTSSEKTSINTNRKSTTRFPMSPRWTLYVVPKPPKGGSKNAKCLKFEQ